MLASGRWSLRAWVAGVTIAWAGPAAAQGVLAEAPHVPLEQRVAIAVGPSRTTIWTQLRTDAKPGQLAIVMSAKAGASLDWSSAAWMEALEIATAPRVFPPNGVVAACPGETPPTDEAVVVGQPFHEEPLAPLEVLVHPDAAAVSSWAAERGLGVSASLADALASLEPSFFVVARFAAPDGVALTPTLRVTAPDMSPTVPLVLTEAGSAELLVSLFTVAEGAASLDGPGVGISLGSLGYDVANADSNYAALRFSSLEAGGPAAWLLETHSRPLFVDGALVDAYAIPGVTSAYFARAQLYDGVSGAACAAAAVAALETTAPVATSCARAALGFVDTGSCTEAPAAGEIDPDTLRCGIADDLAVALSGQVASDARVTRHSLRVAGGSPGVTKTVTIGSAVELLPAHVAANVDFSGCEGPGGAGGAGPSSSSTASASSGSGAGGSGEVVSVDVPVYEVHSDCGATEIGAILFYEQVEVYDEADAPDAYYQEESDCGGDTTSSYEVYESDDDYVANYEDDGDDCGGDTSDTQETTDDGDDCGGDTSESYETTTESYETTETTSDTTSGDQIGASPSGRSPDGCVIARPRRRRTRLSVLTLLAALIVFPVRRVTGRRRS